MSAKRRSTALPPMTATGDRGIRLDVAVRVRPLNAREREGAEGMSWKWEQGKEGVMIDASLGKEKHYPFHHVFDPNATNRAVYDAIASNIVKRAVQGFNGTLFAYGQTGSGKTYSVMGNKSDPGLLPRSIDEVFRMVEGTTDAEFLLRASYLEIYNEQVHDLLQEGDGGRNLRILRDDPIRGAIIKGLTEEIVTSRRQLMDVVRRGESMRHYAATQMNANSSRSHTIYRLVIESKRQLEPEPGAAASAADATEAASAAGIKLAPLVDGGGDGGGGGGGSGGTPDESAMSQVSYLNIVDLAGSERQADAQTAGERLREGSNINQSLLTLQICISKLSEIAAQQKRTALRDAQRAEGRESSRRRGRSSVAVRGQPKVFVPFRDSKMTRVLKQSLGGNAITAILCNMSGHAASKEETMSTLKFGTMCATIETHATKNQVMDDKTLLEQYKKRVQELTKMVQVAEEGRDEHVQVHTAQLRQEHAEATTQMKEQHEAQLRRYDALQGLVLQHGSKHLDHATEKVGVPRRQRAFSAVSMAGALHKDAHVGLGRRFSVSISASAALGALRTAELFQVTADNGGGIDGHSGSDAEGDSDETSALAQLGSGLRHGGAGFARSALRKGSAGRRIVGQGAQPDASSGGGGSGGSGGDGEDLRSLRVQLSELRLQNRKQEQELADLRAEQESSVPLTEHRKEMTEAEVNLAAAMSERDAAQGLEAGLRKDLAQVSTLRDMLKKQLEESQQEAVQARREGAKARREVASLKRELEEAQEQKLPELVALHAPPPVDTPTRTAEAKSLTSLTPSEALARAARAEFHKRDAKAGLEAAKRALSHVKVKGANQERLVQSLQMQLEQQEEETAAAIATGKAAAAEKEAELMAELEALRMSSSILKQQALDVEGGSEGAGQLQVVKLELVQERQLREEAEALLRRLLPTEWERLRSERSSAPLDDAAVGGGSTASGEPGRKLSATVQQHGLDMYRSRSFSGRKGSKSKLTGSDTPRGSRSRSRSKSTARALAGFSSDDFGDFAELADADAPAFRDLENEQSAVDHGALAAAQVEAEMAEEAAAKIREVRAQKNEQAGWVSGTKQYVGMRHHDSMDSLGDGMMHDPGEVDFGFEEGDDEEDAAQGASQSEDGWEQTWHEESQSYYYWNPSTGETRWELPTYERIQIEDHPVQKRRGRRRSTWIGADSDEAGHQGISSDVVSKTQSNDLETSRQRADSETDIDNWLDGSDGSSSEGSRAQHAREFQASVGQHGAPEDVSGVVSRVLQGEDRSSLVEWLLRHPPASVMTPVVSLIHDETTRLAIGAADDQVHAALFLLFVMLKDEPERAKERLKGSTLVSAINDVLLFGVAKGKDAAGAHEKSTSLLVRRCIMILVKLSYDHAVQQDLIVRTGVVDTLKEIMEVYATEPGILAVVECLLSNLMFQSAHNKKLICSACGEELVKVLRRFSARATRSHSMSEADMGDVDALKQDQALMGECVVMALRAIGNLATEDVNVGELVRIGTVRTLAQAMRMPALLEYSEIVHVALDVFANLASVDVPAIRADGDEEARRAALRLHSTINADGAVEAVIEIMRTSDQMQNASFRQSALQALHNMAGGPETALTMVSTGGLSMLVELIEDKEGAMLTIEDTLAVLVAIAQHNQAREAIAHAGIDNGAERDTQAGGHGRRLVAVLMQLLANNGQLGSARSGQSPGADTFVVEQTLALLTELAGSDAVSRIVAKEPVLVCVNMVAQQHFEVPELMFCVFRLLFQLSFVPENVTVLMRAQVAQLIVSAIDHEQHGKDERLMLTCISLLGNMAVTEPGCVPAMQEVDIVAKVREVMLAHRGSERVKSACQGTIVSFEAELTKAKLHERAEGHTTLHASRNKKGNVSARGLALRQAKIKKPSQGDSDRAKARLGHLREMSGHVSSFSAELQSTTSLTASTQSLGAHFSHHSVPSSSSMQAQFDHRGASAALDPHRPMLLAGIGVTEYEKGAQQRHLMIASDLRALIVKRKKKVKGYDAAQVVDVKKGVAKGHSRGRLGGLAGRKAGKDGCCFSITLQHETLYFETHLPTDCDRWVDALNAWRAFVASGALEDEAMVLDSLVTDAWQQRTSTSASVASSRTAVTSSVSSVATSRMAANSLASVAESAAEPDDVPVSHGIA